MLSTVKNMPKQHCIEVLVNQKPTNNTDTHYNKIIINQKRCTQNQVSNNLHPRRSFKKNNFWSPNNIYQIIYVYVNRA